MWFFHQVCLPPLNTVRVTHNLKSPTTAPPFHPRLCVCLSEHMHTLTHTRTNTHTHLRVHALTSKWPLPLTFMCRCMLTFPHLASSSAVDVDFPHAEAHVSCICCYRFHANELLVCENAEIIRAWGKMFRTLFNWWVWLNREEMFYCAPLFIISTINAFSVIRQLEHYLGKDN